MANPNAPFGARPVRHLSGGVLSPNKMAYTIATGYATSLFMGDFVDISGTASADGTGIVVATAGDTNKILGTFAGCAYADANGVPTFSQIWTASTTATGIKAHVFDDQNILFEIQSDATGVQFVDVGMNALFTAGAGSTTTKLSGHVLNATTAVATTATYQLKIRGMSEDPSNAVGAYAKVLVTINNHRLANAVVGA